MEKEEIDFSHLSDIRDLTPDMEHFIKVLDNLRAGHVFLFVEEAHGYIEGSTKSSAKAAKVYCSSVKQQGRWYNPAVYVCNYRPKDKGESSVPRSAVPILSSYNHLRQGVSVLREMYLKNFPSKYLEETGEESL